MTLHEASFVIPSKSIPPDSYLNASDDLSASHNICIENIRNLMCSESYFVSRSSVKFMSLAIKAIEFVLALPEFIELALDNSPAVAKLDSGVKGVFYGYDFHLSNEFPKLIEINSNAGGGLISAYQIHHTKEKFVNFFPENHFSNFNIFQMEHKFLSMFLDEWALFGSNKVLETIAIVDMNPNQQFLKDEFNLFVNLFKKYRLAAFVVDPREITYNGVEVRFGSIKIDLIYNRMTDFYLTENFCRHLRHAYLDSNVAITPNPRSHAIYANKHNLVYLSDLPLLQKLAVPQEYINILAKVVPKTIRVTPASADDLWKNRRLYFFKPVTGYGSKAVYKGEKLTKSTWKDITNSDSYIAQKFIPPGERLVSYNNQLIRMKADLRNYVYNGEVQLTTARLYQGQTTNFRTPGGGFSTVISVDDQLAQKLNVEPETRHFTEYSNFQDTFAIGIH